MSKLASDYTFLCAGGWRGEAITLVMTRAVGQPVSAVNRVRAMPMWPAPEAEVRAR